MPRSESETRRDLIDPILTEKGWGNLIKREETLGRIVLASDDRNADREPRRTDYTLRIPTGRGQQIAVAIIEAKAENQTPGHGVDQAKRYGKRLNVPFCYSSNGHLFVEYDDITGRTSGPKPMAEFPTPNELRVRWEIGNGVDLDSESAKPLTTPYAHGEQQRRGYQDAAIRAALTKLAKEEKRVLLHLATGTGKTFIAANLLKKIANGEQLGRALFLCDRDELRTQALGAMQNYFGGDAAAAQSGDPAKNARVIVGTYQTLGFDDDGVGDTTGSFLSRNYPPGFFTHIIVDEAHRSGFGKWRQVLDQNQDAIQIGLTATPREIENLQNLSEVDQRRLQDTVTYFGEPVYSYQLDDALEDGYLALPLIDRFRIHLGYNPDGEETTRITRAELEEKLVADARTGEVVRETRAEYGADQFERELILPERTEEVCRDLFFRLIRDWGTPETKTVVFCETDDHAGRVKDAMNNLYANWCDTEARKRRPSYAVQITSSMRINALPDFRGAAGHTFVATTVDLLSTGVDLPALRNVVFFRRMQSAIQVSQMVGRGTRLDPATKKLFFRIYDYTDATRLLGSDLISKAAKPKSQTRDEPIDPPGPGSRLLVVSGFQIEIKTAGRFLIGQGGRRMPLEEALHDLGQALRREASDLAELRSRWTPPRARKELILALGSAATVAPGLRHLKEMDDFDFWDFFGETAFQMVPLNRDDRANTLLASSWASNLEEKPFGVTTALMNVFRDAGTDGLEGSELFNVPAVTKAGGLAALGGPARVLELRGVLFA